MFTGLIQGLGRIRRLEKRGQETRMAIQPAFAIPDIALGESIAVNGACLTVESFGSGASPEFTVYASAESLSRTSLGSLKVGDTVNLERALALGDRLGGHMVAGHVDCLATVESVSPAGQSTVYRLAYPEVFSTQVVEKGSVALDGISLTVNHCGPGFLSVNIIPETQRTTTIASWTTGRGVNMETDLIGKYVERMLAAWKGTSRQGAGDAPASAITESFLRRHGF